jgi:CRP-like cAMP-binding protein
MRVGAVWLSNEVDGLSWASVRLLHRIERHHFNEAFTSNFERRHLQMNPIFQIGIASLLGLATTSSSILGAVIGLYLPLSKRPLACLLAFAAGSLISALAIELAFESAQSLHQQGYNAHAAWAFVSSGFAAGAMIYYWASLFLERKGAAVRYVTQFREYARARKTADTAERIKLLSTSDLMRHLPADQIEAILDCIRDRTLKSGDILFKTGDPGDALYIVARGKIEVLKDGTNSEAIAILGPGSAFGEMALLSGGPRTATIRAVEDTELLEIAKQEFDTLIDNDRQFAEAVARISHQRAISNLSAGGTGATVWAKVAARSLDVDRREAGRLLAETAKGAGIAIVLGNILDTIPGCLVIGAKFSGFGNLSLTLMFGMFLGGIPEAAASASMLRKAGYRPAAIFGLWSTVLIAGIVAAAIGKAFIGSNDALEAIFAQALAGGAVLALVAHAMIPVALEEGGSLVVLPTVAGFLFALYLALAESFV